MYINTSPRRHLMAMLVYCDAFTRIKFNCNSINTASIFLLPSVSRYKSGSLFNRSQHAEYTTMRIKRGGRRGSGGLEYPPLVEFLKWERRERATTPDTPHYPRYSSFPGLPTKLLRAEGEFWWVSARRVIKFWCMYASSEHTLDDGGENKRVSRHS